MNALAGIELPKLYTFLGVPSQHKPLAVQQVVLSNMWEA